MGMAHIVPEHWFLPGYITYATQNIFLNYIFYLFLPIKKARKFTGLCVFDKWKGYQRQISNYHEIIIRPFPSRPVMLPPSGFGIVALPAIVSASDTPPI